MTEKINVSVIVMTKNEKANIRRCLDSLRAFSEVWVVDSGSTDGTQDIAASLGAQVVPFTWNGKYPKKKQWCLDNLRLGNDLVLFVDADEVVPDGLCKEIRGVTEHASLAGWWVDLEYVFLGRPLKHGHRVRKLALLRRQQARFPVVDDLAASNMWEVEGHYQPVLRGSAGRLRQRLRHDDQEPLYHWFDKHNRYSDWEVALAESGRRVVSRRARILQRLPFKPVLFFLYSYLWRLGVLDGPAGYHYALANSFYYWQVSVKRRDPHRGT